MSDLYGGMAEEATSVWRTSEILASITSALWQSSSSGPSRGRTASRATLIVRDRAIQRETETETETETERGRDLQLR